MLFKSKLFYVYLIVFSYLTNYICIFCNGKKMAFNIERPKILYYNTSHVRNVFVATRRYNRTNPLYFVTFKCETLHPFTNDYEFSYYIYQLLSNTYKRTFVEFHVMPCDLFKPDHIFYEILKESYYRTPESQRPMKVLKCPVKPGYYILQDLKLRLLTVPENFPFRQGRLYFNVTYKEVNIVGTGYADIELKSID